MREFSCDIATDTHPRVYTHTHKNNESKSFLYLEAIDKITVIFFTQPFFHSIKKKKQEGTTETCRKKERMKKNEKTLGFK